MSIGGPAVVRGKLKLAPSNLTRSLIFTNYEDHMVKGEIYSGDEEIRIGANFKHLHSLRHLLV